MGPSLASKRLRALATPTPKISIARIARACGVTKQAVSQWLGGFVRPSDKYRGKLEKLTGIPASEWDVEIDDEFFATGTDGR